MNLESLVLRLIGSETEEPCIEFKGSKNDSEMIGKDISALSNSTIIYDEPVAFMIWGVSDVGHDVIGTTFNPTKQKVGNEDLINWLHQNVTNNVEYTFEETTVLEKRVVILTIKNLSAPRQGSEMLHTPAMDPTQSPSTNCLFLRRDSGRT